MLIVATNKPWLRQSTTQPCPNPVLSLSKPAPGPEDSLTWGSAPEAPTFLHQHLENKGSLASCANHHSRGNIYMFNTTAQKNEDGDKVVCGSQRNLL